MPSIVHRILLALVLFALTPTAALAEWRRAESAHFIVYSDGSERLLRDYTTKLERFDALLRSQFPSSADDDGRKLPVYLVADARALRIAQPDLPEGIDGYYSANENDIFAILVRGREDDILLHEYGHHFMAKSGDAEYPGWLSEGFAEYFATATVSGRGEATFGLPNPGRQYALQQRRWLPMEVLLRARGSFDIETDSDRGMYYAQAWALTHWILADLTRRQNLSRYLAAINGGGDPVEAWRTVFGLTPEQLTTQLRGYVQGRLYYSKLDLPPLDPEMTVTTLSPAADAVLLPMIHARDPRTDETEGAQLLATLRAAAARFPDDPLALTALGRAEARWGDAAAAEAALARALERQADQVEALLLMASVINEQADVLSDEAERIRRLRQAQGFLRRALEADAADFRTYAALARLRRNAMDYPTENDLLTWSLAVQYAPQVMSIRGDAAVAMIEGRQYNEALHLLVPIINNPHGGAGVEYARQLVEEIDRRRAEPEEETEVGEE